MSNYQLPGFIKSFLLVLAFIALSLILVDIIAGWLVTDPRIKLAKQYGVEYDRRTRLQVVIDCQRNNPDCFPSVPPSTFIEHGLRLNNSVILPLSGVANATLIGCNESGYFPTYTSDGFGFRNPASAWEGSGPIELAFVGNSYTAGDCVRKGAGFVDKLRESYSSLVNLASGGNGPLYELATIKEYLNNKQVDYVFWVYFERDDLENLERDMKSVTLLKYLEPGFKQGLIAKHDKIDSTLRRYIRERITIKEQGRARILPNLRLILWKIRNKEFNTDKSHSSEKTLTFDLPIFQKILVSAKNTVEENGGQLVFVYLPEYERFNRDIQSAPWSGSHLKNRVLDIVNSQGIDLIDIEAVFQKARDPLNFFPFRIPGHYNEAGNTAVASEIQKYLSTHRQ